MYMLMTGQTPEPSSFFSFLIYCPFLSCFKLEGNCLAMLSQFLPSIGMNQP